ncbi:hypothetical protein, partial [Paracoccus sp. AS002]|uniref:hypothetical protein n=1 Tax=Paracoccus sp. AS002 TaxID=3019545 RepID=UPI0023E774F6
LPASLRKKHGAFSRSNRRGHAHRGQGHQDPAAIAKGKDAAVAVYEISMTTEDGPVTFRPDDLDEWLDEMGLEIQGYNENPASARNCKASPRSLVSMARSGAPTPMMASPSFATKIRNATAT